MIPHLSREIQTEYRFATLMPRRQVELTLAFLAIMDSVTR